MYIRTLICRRSCIWRQEPVDGGGPALGYQEERFSREWAVTQTLKRGGCHLREI